MQFKIVFEASGDGGFTVFVPALPGCISEGDTVDEARSNILEAIALYLEPGGNADEPLVLPAGSFVQEISI